MGNEIPYGKRVKDGRSVRASEVERGKQCGCVCPGCGKPLEACLPKKEIADYFRHAKGSSCVGALESSLHLEAKEILSEIKEIRLPSVQFDFPGKQPPALLSESKTIQLDKVILEPQIGTIRPDLIADYKGVQLLIEIYVTHPVDEEKLSKIRDMGISAIQVDLSEHPRDFDRETLKKAICHELEGKSWLHNNVIERFREGLKRFGIRYPIGFSGSVNQCPIEIRAHFEDDCKFCPYCVLFEENESSIIIGHVQCTGNGKLPTQKIVDFMRWERANRATL